MSALELFFSYILLIAGGNINETNNFNFHDSIIRIFHNMGSKNEASNKPTGKCVLIFAFSYFYTEITMNPEEIANNIKKSGGNIAGIRAGSSTAEYLRKQMKYLIAIGSFCLCIIAIIPFIVSGLTGLSRLSFFGTSIIITVSVILETKKLILSKTQENYYMNRVKKGGLFRG